MFKKFGFGLIGLLGGVAVAQAGMIIDIEGSDTELDFKGWFGSVERVHNLGDNDAANIFVPGQGTQIDSGRLTLNIWNEYTENEELDGEKDTIEFNLGDGVQSTSGSNPLWDSLIFVSRLGDVALGTLNDDGELIFSITGMGDYWVGESKLELVTSSQSASVPEPGVLMLLGLGLVGLRVARPKAA